MSDYDNQRPTAGTPYSDPCAVKDMATTLGKVVDGSSTVTTYNGNQILSLAQAIDRFGFGVADFTFTDGGTLESLNLLVSNSPTDGYLYKYVGAGSAPIVVTAGTDPTIGGNWQAFAATSLQALSGLTDPSDLDKVHARNIDSIKSLSSYSPIDGQTFKVRGFYTGSFLGGGEFVWDSTKSKALHNGGTILDPVRIAAWDGTYGDLSTLYTTCLLYTSPSPRDS